MTKNQSINTNPNTAYFSDGLWRAGGYAGRPSETPFAVIPVQAGICG
ncbi:hypothetical protein [Neisseria sp.]